MKDDTKNKLNEMIDRLSGLSKLQSSIHVQDLEDVYTDFDKIAKRLSEKIQRKTGRTTRIINDAIEELLKTGYVNVFDHTGKKEEVDHIFIVVSKRLLTEHRISTIYSSRIIKDSMHGLHIKFEK